MGVSLIPTTTNLSRLSFTLDPVLSPASGRDIAALDFPAVSNYHSASVTLDAQSLLAAMAGPAR